MILNNYTHTTLKNAFEYDFNTCVKGIPHYSHYLQSIAKIICDYNMRNNYQKINILDIGCGTGNIISYLNNQNYSFNYLGLDINQYLLNFATQKYSSSQIRFFKKDALVFLKNSNTEYDIVINSWTFHNWNDKYRIKVLDFLYKKLKLKGLYIAADKIASNNENTHQVNYKAQMDYVQKVFKDRPDIIEEWISHYEDDERESIKITERAFINQLSYSGFKDIQLLARDYMDILLTGAK